MAYMAKADGGTDEMKGAEIETVVVDADDVVEAMKRNRRDEDQQRTHVLRVSPPLEGEREASLYVSESHARYPADATKPIHLEPKQFLGSRPDEPLDSTLEVPRRTEARIAAETDNDDEQVDENLVDEYHKVAMDDWESNVRASLADEIVLAYDPRTGEQSTATVEILSED